MRSLAILLLLHGCLAPRLILAQSETPAEDKPASETDVANAETSASEDREKRRKKQKVEIGLILTSGIVMLGIFLVTLTLLYGRRTKRQLASGRGPTSPRDDLWYLKKTREAPSTDVSDAEQEEESQ